jgi:DHA1 family purine ribonucleoside efflux pump-like MFS transporter
LSQGAAGALEAAGSLMVVSFQVAISIGAVLGGYIVDHYGASGPLILTTVLAATTIFLALPRARN